MDRVVRMLDGDATETERALLDSAAEDVPSPLARQQTLAALGVGAAAVVAAPAVARAATSLASAAGSAKVGSTVSFIAVLKWIGTGAVVGSVAAAGIATVTTPGLVFVGRAAKVVSAAPPPGPAQRSSPKLTPTPGAMEALPPPPAFGAPSLPGMASPPRLERGAAPSLPRPQSEPPPLAPERQSASTVMAEVASLDRARAALSVGDARGALSRLSSHEATFPDGALEPEAVVLRVRALTRLGARAEAASAARQFLASHPDSAQAARLRALVSAGP